ncbi:spore protease YyaC [Ureibacillus sp. NPDC094379]
MVNNKKYSLKVLPIVNSFEKGQFIGGIAELLELSLSENRTVVILCIGTDQSTGDSFGPLVGSLLVKERCVFPVFGTIEYPVDALNLQQTIKKIYKKFEKPIIFAIDASLGKKEQIGTLYFREGSLCPGKSTYKKLPAVGDFQLCAVVNECDSPFFPSKINETRLYHVYLLANETASIIMQCGKLSTENIKK